MLTPRDPSWRIQAKWKDVDSAAATNCERASPRLAARLRLLQVQGFGVTAQERHQFRTALERLDSRSRPLDCRWIASGLCEQVERTVRGERRREKRRAVTDSTSWEDAKMRGSGGGQQLRLRFELPYGRASYSHQASVPMGQVGPPKELAPGLASIRHGRLAQMNRILRILRRSPFEIGSHLGRCCGGKSTDRCITSRPNQPARNSSRSHSQANCSGTKTTGLAPGFMPVDSIPKHSLLPAAGLSIDENRYRVRRPKYSFWPSPGLMLDPCCYTTSLVYSVR